MHAGKPLHACREALKVSKKIKKIKGYAYAESTMLSAESTAESTMLSAERAHMLPMRPAPLLVGGQQPPATMSRRLQGQILITKKRKKRKERLIILGFIIN